MAGIGFELRRMMHAEGSGVGARLRALLTATLLTAGPWLVTMATLVVVSLFGGGNGADDAAFRTIVTYCFAISMVVVGAVQMPMTRYLADLLHERRYASVLPAFSAACVGVGAVQAVAAGCYVWWVAMTPTVAVMVVALYVAVSLNWLAMAWLTVVRQHGQILAAFLLGLFCSALVVSLAGSRIGSPVRSRATRWARA